MHQDIAINRLKIQAGKGDAADILFGLENQSWSGYSSPGEWLFVRQLSLQGPKSDLMHRAGNALQNAVFAAVDGGSPLADSANAVKFSCLPELLSFMLRDLLDASFVRKWYWENWRYLGSETRANAVARLLWEYAAYLPAVVDSLIERNLLAEVWRHLTPQSAAEIASRLEAVAPASGPATLAEPESPALTDIETLVSKRLRTMWPRLRVWAEALGSIPMLDSRSRLAHALIARQSFPRLWFARREIVEQLIYREIARSRVSPEFRNGERAASADSPARVGRGRAGSASAIDGPAADFIPASAPGAQARASDAIAAPPELAEERGDAPDREDFDAGERAAGAAATPLASQLAWQRRAPVGEAGDIDSSLKAFALAGAESTGSVAATGAADPGQDYFETAYGGLFYLINPMSSESCQQLLQQDDAARTGWLWLYDLARRLPVTLDQGMLQLLTGICGFEKVEQLLEMPPLPVVDAVAPMLSAQLSARGLWSPELLELRARIFTSASHVDCYFPLESARLEVRLAGLDLNPGWVPWLGRVIAFHYDDKAFGTL